MVEIRFGGGRCLTPEGIDFEVKSAQGGLPNNLWESYSAFTNTSGGTILLGVREVKGEGLMIEGVPDVQGTINGLWNGLNNREKVSVNLLSDGDVEVMEVEGRQLIRIDVPQADRRDRPVHINGNTRNSFRRNGEGDYRCSPEEIDLMITDSVSGPTDRVPISTSKVEDLDPDTIRSYRNSLRTLKPDHPWNVIGDEEFLRVTGSATEVDGNLVPTLAGLLMFGRAYCITSESYGYFLDYREYTTGEGWDRRITSNDGEWSGNVFDFYIRVMNEVRLYIGRGFEMDDDMRRVEDTKLDKSIREALVNALVNADYRGGGVVLVECRPGLFTVRNGGTFRIRLERAMRGGYSDSRNRTLALMFSLIGVVEQAGSGIHRIITYSRDLGLSDPVFAEEFNPDTVTVTLSTVPGRRLGGDMDETILEMLAADGSMSISKMAERLDVPRSNVTLAVGRLKASGRLTRVGGNRGRWVVNGRR